MKPNLSRNADAVDAARRARFLDQRICHIDTIPSVQQAAAYDVNRIGQAEGVRQSLYDAGFYPTAGLTQLLFFQTPRGQAGSTTPGLTTAAAKNITDTNMEAAGQLPSPKAFLVESIEILFLPGSVATALTYTPLQIASYTSAVVAAALPAAGGGMNDLNIAMCSGELQFFIGSKSYLDEAPLMRFPPKVQFTIDAAFGANLAAVSFAAIIGSAKNTGRPYYVNPPIFLTPTQNWNISLNWPVVQATPSGFNARVFTILDGFLYRNSQ